MVQLSQIESANGLEKLLRAYEVFVRSEHVCKSKKEACIYTAQAHLIGIEDIFPRAEIRFESLRWARFSVGPCSPRRGTGQFVPGDLRNLP